jgi:hypothetical protein
MCSVSNEDNPDLSPTTTSRRRTLPRRPRHAPRPDRAAIAGTYVALAKQGPTAVGRRRSTGAGLKDVASGQFAEKTDVQRRHRFYPACGSARPGRRPTPPGP